MNLGDIIVGEPQWIMLPNGQRVYGKPVHDSTGRFRGYYPVSTTGSGGGGSTTTTGGSSSGGGGTTQTSSPQPSISITPSSIDIVKGKSYTVTITMHNAKSARQKCTNNWGDVATFGTPNQWSPIAVWDGPKTFTVTPKKTGTGICTIEVYSNPDLTGTMASASLGSTVSEPGSKPAPWQAGILGNVGKWAMLALLLFGALSGKGKKEESK